MEQLDRMSLIEACSHSLVAVILEMEGVVQTDFPSFKGIKTVVNSSYCFRALLE